MYDIGISIFQSLTFTMFLVAIFVYATTFLKDRKKAISVAVVSIIFILNLMVFFGGFFNYELYFFYRWTFFDDALLEIFVMISWMFMIVSGLVGLKNYREDENLQKTNDPYYKYFIMQFFILLVISILAYRFYAFAEIQKYVDYLASTSSNEDIRFWHNEHKKSALGRDAIKPAHRVIKEKLALLDKEEYLKLKNKASEYFKQIEIQGEQEKIEKEAQAKKDEEQKRQEILESLDI